MMITDSGVIIRVEAEEISKIGRNTQGVRIMKLKGDKTKIVAIALTPHEEEEETSDSETPIDETAESSAAVATETAVANENGTESTEE